MRPTWIVVALVVAGCGRGTPEAPLAPVAPATAPAVAPPPAAPSAPPKPPEPPPTDILPLKTINTGIEASAVVLSPDGGRFSTAGNDRLARGGSSRRGVTYVYDIASGEPVGSPFPEPVKPALSDRGLTAAYFRPGWFIDCSLVLREVVSGRETVVEPPPLGAAPRGKLAFVAITPDAKRVVVARWDQLEFLDCPSGKPYRPAARPASPVARMSATYLGGSRVLTLHESGRACAWDTARGEVVGEFDLGRKVELAEPVEVAEDGRAMVLAGSGGGETFWDLRVAKPVPWPSPSPYLGRLPVPGGRVAFKKDDYDAKPRSFVTVANLGTGTPRHRLLHLNGWGDPGWRGLAASGDGRRIVASIPEQTTVCVWDLPAR